MENPLILRDCQSAKFNVKETAYEDWTSSLLENTKWNGTIQKNQVSKITVKNTYEAKRQLTVEKTVTGSMGSKTKQFHFQLKLTAPTGKVLPDTLEYTKGEENGVIKLKDGVYEFTLAHAEKIVIEGIPSQSSYTVTEVDGESNGYKVTKTNDTGNIKADTTVSFVNTKNGSVPTLLTYLVLTYAEHKDSIRACDSCNWRSWIHFVEETEGDKIVKSCCYVQQLSLRDEGLSPLVLFPCNFRT